MAAVSELIRKEADGTLSFGDYTLGAKAKLDNFEHCGDLYKVKTFKEITKLEKNGLFVYESVPGSKVFGLVASENGVCFKVEAAEDLSITLELEENATYNVTVGGKNTGAVSTKLGGKLNLSVEMDGTPVEIKVEKA